MLENGFRNLNIMFFHRFFCVIFRPEKMVVEVVKKEQVSSSYRKTQKSDREKIRRDKLNEQFLELGNALGIYIYTYIYIISRR